MKSMFISYCVTFILLCAFCGIEVVSAQHNINWSNITESELSGLNATVFLTVTADELTLLSKNKEGMVCAGFRPDQVLLINATAVDGIDVHCFENFPVEAFANFNASQVYNFNLYACYGVNSSHLAALNPAAYMGLTGDCLSHLENVSCSGLSTTGISNIPAEAFSHIGSICLQSVKPEAFGNLTANQIQVLGNSTCKGIIPTQIEVVRATLSNFRNDCINNWNEAVINSLSSEQVVTYLTMDQIRGFSPDTIVKMNQILSKFSPDQLGYFSSAAVGALSAQQLVEIYKNMGVGLDLMYLYPTNTASAFSVDTMLSFKGFVDNGTVTPIESSKVTNFNDSTSWLTIALIDNSIQTVFQRSNFTMVKILPSPSLSGLRVGQLPTLGPQFFAELNANQTHYLLPDALRNISGNQYAALQPNAIAGINPDYAKYINSNIYDQLSCDQIIAINNEAGLMSNITSDKDTSAVFNNKLVSCTFGLISQDTLWIGFGISAAIIIVLTIIAIVIISRKGDYNAV